jgi:hypothetical protein
LYGALLHLYSVYYTAYRSKAFSERKRPGERCARVDAGLSRSVHISPSRMSVDLIPEVALCPALPNS